MTPAGGGVERDREPLPTRVEALPELPPSYEAALDDGLRALGETLRPATRRAIGDHVRLMLAWTRAINLTAIREPEAVALEHVIDSLSAAPVLRARGITRLLDLGSGAGFPGVPLALGLDADALLVESVAKKSRFLETAVRAIDATATIRVAATRAEGLAHDAAYRERWSAVVVRAVAGLADLAEVGLPLVERGGVLVAWKRLPIEHELAVARDAIHLAGGGPVELIGSHVPGLEDHLLVVIGKTRPSPPGYPRDTARRRARRA
jgi:16S rRNA (guanine527-N7)-methyltransferase